MKKIFTWLAPETQWQRKTRLIKVLMKKIYKIGTRDSVAKKFPFNPGAYEKRFT